MTHAFFKGLPFPWRWERHACPERRTGYEKDGGFSRKKIPYTFWTFSSPLLAIAGIPGSPDFLGKDEILWQAFSSPTPPYYVGGAIAAG